MKSEQGVYYPIESLEQKWKNGDFKKIREHLFTWLERHKGDLTNAQAARNILSVKGSVHLPSEMADQIKEINKEIWYQGEKGHENRQEIKENWTQNYSLLWREARKTEILFVFDKELENIQKLFS